MKRLLAGELVDIAGLEYELDGCHLGLIATGSGVEEAIRDLAASLDTRLLLVRRDELTVWVWLGGRRTIDPDRLEQAASDAWPPALSLALGEPAQGLAGWRLTHRQAAALPIAQRGPDSVIRYANVALLAAIVQDDLLATSLRQLYLTPLRGERDGGANSARLLRRRPQYLFGCSHTGREPAGGRQTSARNRGEAWMHP